MNTLYKALYFLLFTGSILHGSADASSLGSELQSQRSSSLTVICKETTPFEQMQKASMPEASQLLKPSTGGKTGSLYVICQDATQTTPSTLLDVVKPTVNAVAQQLMDMGGLLASTPANTTAAAVVTPSSVPEPSTLLLLGGGLLGLVAFFKRHHRK